MQDNILLNMKEASTLLGIRQWTLYNWVSRRKIPYVKCGKLTKFSKAKLLSWIDKNSFEPLSRRVSKFKKGGQKNG